MAKRYQHLTDQIRADIANRVGGLIWAVPKPSGPDEEDGSAGVPAPV